MNNQTQRTHNHQCQADTSDQRMEDVVRLLPNKAKARAEAAAARAAQQQVELIAWEGFARAALIGLLGADWDSDAACDRATYVADKMMENRSGFIAYLNDEE